MADPTVDVTLNVNGVESQKIPVYPGSSLKFCLQSLLDSRGLHYSQLKVHDITTNSGVRWDCAVDGVLYHSLLITVASNERRRSEGTRPNFSGMGQYPPAKSNTLPKQRIASEPLSERSRQPLPSPTLSIGRSHSDRLPARPPREENGSDLKFTRGRRSNDRLPATPPQLLSSPREETEHDYEDDVFQPPTSTKEDVTNLHCYHGALDPIELERIMSSQLHRPFSYLVRESRSSPGSLTASVTHYENHIYHFRIEKTSSGTHYFITEDRKFPSLASFLKYYSSHTIPGQKVQDLKLIYPISKEDARPVYDPDAGYTELFRDNSHVAAPRRPKRWSSISSRPPPPLPTADNVNIQRRKSMPPDYIRMINKRMEDSKDIYSVPSDLKESMLSTLIRILERQDLQGQGSRSSAYGGQRCFCGMLVEEATLINGWMMHRSDDAESEGQVYFAKGQEVLWSLPQDIWLELVRNFPEKAARVLSHIGYELH